MIEKPQRHSKASQRNCSRTRQAGATSTIKIRSNVHVRVQYREEEQNSSRKNPTQVARKIFGAKVHARLAANEREP
jgi:hypothetical protein